MSTSGDVIAMLRRHYLPEGKPPGGVFAPEIGSPDGKRRADLIWHPTTIAGGRGLVGHEVKVSRSDVLVELSDPTKADPWARYCTRWWLVVSDPALVDGLDIPEAWGVMSPPSGRRTRSMTVLKPAPKLTPHDPAPGLARLLAWQLYGTHETIARLRGEVAWKDLALERARADVDEARLTGGHASPHTKRLNAILAEVSRRARDEHLWADIEDDYVIEAILDAEATRRAATATRRVIDSLVRDVERAASPFQSAKTDLERAQRLGAELAQGDLFGEASA